MRKFVVSIFLALFLFSAWGCVYQANLSQGNVIKQEDLDLVEVGMTQGQENLENLQPGQRNFESRFS